MAKIRNILVAVSGLSPQILTETLYALVEEQKFVPDEIHIITTNTGSSVIRTKLLEGENSILNQFCEDLKTEMRGMRYTLCQDNDDPMKDYGLFCRLRTFHVWKRAGQTLTCACNSSRL